MLWEEDGIQRAPQQGRVHHTEEHKADVVELGGEMRLEWCQGFVGQAEEFDFILRELAFYGNVIRFGY